MIDEPTTSVGILDGRHEISGSLNGNFHLEGCGVLSGRFQAKVVHGTIVLANEEDREITRSPSIRLVADDKSTFTIAGVVIGIGFHWERSEEQTFQGNLILKLRSDETIAAVNEIPVEDYLKSVISSEMSATAPPEFLKAHAILSRSWLLRTLERKKDVKTSTARTGNMRENDGNDGEVSRWYEQDTHDIFDVCADDHCQRYQGITKIITANAAMAVEETRGQIVMYGSEICDARYSKACGGLTEEFGTAWEDKDIPYLATISDSPSPHTLIKTEEEAARWILDTPEVYCNTRDKTILENILPDFDRETKAFFRWTVEYSRKDLEEIIEEKSGIDFGTLQEIMPLSRGTSGRIYRLRITGSKRSIVVGKELEIRRWLSKSHLYSSAFVVNVERDSLGGIHRFIFKGAGWGHGVGLCQIGAAVMAAKGFTAWKILEHYFPGAQIRNIYK